MNAVLCRMLDRVVIRLSVRPAPDPPSPPCDPRRLRSSLVDLASEARGRGDGKASPVVWQEDGFTFESPGPFPWPELRPVRGQWFAPTRPGAPVVVLVHGWNAEKAVRHLFPRLAGMYRRRGWGCAWFYLPFHGPRRPSSPGAMQDLIWDDPVQVLEGIRMALRDIGTLVHALQTREHAVLLWGYSLGAWLTGLALEVNPEVAAGVLMTPVVNMGEALRTLEFARPLGRALAPFAKDLGALDLPRRQAPPDPSRVLFAVGTHDAFADRAGVKSLQRSWPGSGWLEWPHGHISLLFSARAHREVCGELDRRLGMGK